MPDHGCRATDFSWLGHGKIPQSLVPEPLVPSTAHSSSATCCHVRKAQADDTLTYCQRLWCSARRARLPTTPLPNEAATHALGRCGTAHGASATCARAAPATQQSPGYSTRTRHRQMTGRVIGSEAVRYEMSTDYSVMHRNANAAGKVTAKTLPHALTAARASGMHG